MNIYIYIYSTPPRPSFTAKSLVFTVFSSHLELLKFRVCFSAETLPYLEGLFPSHPSLSTSHSRFKIHKKTS